MGFYVRKSVRVGPFRFNLSRSGIGVSAGIKGFRVGSGPRGNYIHMGREGLYYRASLPGSSGTVQPFVPSLQPASQSNESFADIDSGSVLQMRDGSAGDLLKELNEKHRKPRLWMWVLGASIAAGFLLFSTDVGAVVFLAGAAASALVAQWDRYRRTTVLLYDLEDDAVRQYQILHDALDQLASCHGLWHMEAKAPTRDYKRNSGASTLVKRKRTSLTKTPPRTIRTNIEVPTLAVGRQTLCFLPERLIVIDRDGVGAVSYSDLKIEISASRYIESETVPRDAEVIDQTWRYVNKKGGPDRRFANNSQIPICRYGQVAFSSSTGLNEVVQTSKADAGAALVAAVLAQVPAKRTA